MRSSDNAGARRRSVLFLNQSYYHFFYLARALRKRGWDAQSVTTEDAASPHAMLYHGVDRRITLRYGSLFDKAVSFVRMHAFLASARRRFRLVHFAGDGQLSFLPWRYKDESPPDITAWRRAGLRVAYTSSGCNSGTSQSAVAQWSATLGAGSVCERCVWQHRPEICNDERNLAWGRKVARYCDLICSEMLPALDYMQAGPRMVREPLTTALDPDIWDPALPIPEQYREARRPDEILVYHGFANYRSRDAGGRNIKGTPAIFAAVERLQREGLPVRLIFRTDVPSSHVRFIQVQADVIVDQLNYGRYGATAREGMMLGKPVVCYSNPSEHRPEDRLQCLRESPLISATEGSVYAVLKDLVLDAGRRRAVGEASRRYAMKWHSADACAERYEQVYDDMMARAPERGCYDVD